jgi:hypothetical protein
VSALINWQSLSNSRHILTIKKPNIKNKPLNFIIRHFHPDHNVTDYLFKIHFNNILQPMHNIILQRPVAHHLLLEPPVTVLERLRATCNLICKATRSLDTQHNRKRHPAPWNTRESRWDYTSEPQNRIITVSTNNFETPDDDQCRSKHVLQCTETFK